MKEVINMNKWIIIVIAVLIGVPCALASIGFIIGFIGAAIMALCGCIIELIAELLGCGWLCAIIAITCGLIIFNQLTKKGP
jgi:hypothetical protein